MGAQGVTDDWLCGRRRSGDAMSSEGVAEPEGSSRLWISMLKGGTKCSKVSPVGSGVRDKASASTFFSPGTYWISVIWKFWMTLIHRAWIPDSSRCSMIHFNEQWSVFTTNGSPMR
jgi:hypothetical protein